MYQIGALCRLAKLIGSEKNGGVGGGGWVGGWNVNMIVC